MMSHINVGSGEDCTIAEVAQLVADVTGFNGRIEFDQQQARWHSSKATRRQPAAFPWLECCNQPARRA